MATLFLASAVVVSYWLHAARSRLRARCYGVSARLATSARPGQSRPYPVHRGYAFWCRGGMDTRSRMQVSEPERGGEGERAGGNRSRRGRIPPRDKWVTPQTSCDRNAPRSGSAALSTAAPAALGRRGAAAVRTAYVFALSLVISTFPLFR